MMVANRPLKILIVEHEPLVALVFGDFIVDAGWQLIGPASTLQQAVRLAGSADCDCAVLDIILDEGVTSFPVAAILRDRGIPFLFATGVSFPFLPTGFEGVPVMKKPFRYGAFIHAVRDLQAPAR